jgi:hypothetical protein
VQNASSQESMLKTWMNALAVILGFAHRMCVVTILRIGRRILIMKIFDNWIKKQFCKRFPDEFIRIEAPFKSKIITSKVNIIKSKQFIELAKETDDLIPYNVKLEELSRKFIPLIADNINIRRFEDPLRQLVIYEAMLEIIPAEKGVIHDEEEEERQ